MAIPPIMIGIAGASGSGKSTLAGALGRALPPGAATVVSLDSYHRDRSAEPWESRCRANFDEPSAIDVDLLLEQLTSLGRGELVHAPEYDFGTHVRKASAQVLEPREWIVVEGLFALYWPELRDLLGLKVFVDTDLETCKERRLARDVAERGRTLAAAGQQFEATVRPMYARHVHPTRAHADLVVSGVSSPDRSAAIMLDRVLGARAVGGSRP
jgi:uridine kinase